MLARFIEKALEIYLVSSIGIFCKTDSTEQSVIVAYTVKICAVYAAKVDEVKCSSTHYEERLKGVARIISGSDNIVKYSALGRKLELTYPRKCAVIISRIGEKLGLVFNTAAFADALLLGF